MLNLVLSPPHASPTIPDKPRGLAWLGLLGHGRIRDCDLMSKLHDMILKFIQGLNSVIIVGQSQLGMAGQCPGMVRPSRGNMWELVCDIFFALFYLGMYWPTFPHSRNLIEIHTHVLGIIDGETSFGYLYLILSRPLGNRHLAHVPLRP